MSWLSSISALGSSRSQFTSRMAPCPSGPHVHVAWGGQTGLGLSVVTPSTFHGDPGGLAPPFLYLIHQRLAHRAATGGVGVQRDLCRDKDAWGGGHPRHHHNFGVSPHYLPTQVRYNMALPTGTPPASP